MLKIYKYQIKLTTNLLTNNHINIKTFNNKIYIINNPFDINIEKLLKRNYIIYKYI
jgi:hypothetical protein